MQRQQSFGFRGRVFARTLALAAGLSLVAQSARSATTRYVWPGSPNPTPPYTDWTTAARVIQDAVNTAQVGDLVLVTNGTYVTGGRAMATAPLMKNRVAIDKAVTIRSVNGPSVTVIQGARAPGGGNGDGAVRCAYLADGATLSGFTLSNGATRAAGDWESERSGGGAWCVSTNAVLTNCVLTGNLAFDGGGAHGGTLNNCALTGNSAFLYYEVKCTPLGDCYWIPMGGGTGGGAASSTLFHCTLGDNWAEQVGGGTADGTLYNCTLTGNSAGYAGGAYAGTLYNCTVAGNSARESGGGTTGSTLFNSIVSLNQAPAGANHREGRFEYTCTTPLPPGPGNIAADPGFVNAAAGDFRLRPDSPCINAGSNEFAWGDTDFAGNPRISASRVDMGAFEYQVPFFTHTMLTPQGMQMEWPATTRGSALQRSATLNPAAWQDVSGSEAVTTVTVPVKGASEFFRLVRW